jgi:hypothetical protein
VTSRPAAILAACAALAVTSLAQAQEPSDKAAAEALYEQGHALDAQGHYLQACPKYAESLRLDPGIGVMLHLASCWEKAGKPASAWAEYREAEQVAVRAGDSRSDVARKRAEALESRLFRLTIVVPAASSVEGLALARDGEAVGPAQWGSSVPVDPGEHTVVAVAPGKRRWESKFLATEQSGSTTLTVPVLVDDAPSALPAPLPAAATTPDETPRAPFWSTQRIVAVAVAGAGVVGVGVGTYFGILTKVKLDQSNAPGDCQPNSHCSAAGAALRTDAQNAATVSTVAFGIGLAALAGGAALWLTAPRPQGPRVGAVASPGFSGVFVTGTW